MQIITDWKMQLIFDNAGGTTIQAETFAAHYTNAADAARDAMLIVGGGDTSDWESDEEARIDADSLDKWERAGAALSLQVADILAAKAEGVYASSWFNVRNFFRALGCSVSERVYADTCMEDSQKYDAARELETEISDTTEFADVVLR